MLPQRVAGSARLFYIPGYPQHQLRVLALGPALLELLDSVHEALDQAYPGDPFVHYRGQDLAFRWFDLPDLMDEAIKCVEIASPEGERLTMIFWEGMAMVDESRTILWVLDYTAQAVADFTRAALTRFENLQRIAQKYDEDLR